MHSALNARPRTICWIRPKGSWPGVNSRGCVRGQRASAPSSRRANELTHPSETRVREQRSDRLMRLLAVIFGILLIVLVAQDAFETIVLPRRVTRRIRLARLFYRVIQFGWNSIGYLIRSSARRDSFRGYMGPLSLLALLLFWAVLFVLGFGLVLWGLALPLGGSDKTISFLTYLYLSSTTFFTLGLGDVTPLSGVGRFLVVSEVALGFIFLALVISYVPV